jgi:predicted RNase H-like HicB family nuclease
MQPRIRYAALVFGSHGEFAAWCPALPGCWSQGATRGEALENIRAAMRDYVRIARTLHPRRRVRR